MPATLSEKKLIRDGKKITNKMVFSFLGRLHAQKNPKFLVNAWNRIKEKEAVHLLMIGSGPMYEELADIIKKLSLQKSITLVGKVDNPVNYLKASDVFRYCSRDGKIHL